MVRFPTLTLNAWGTAPTGMADTLPWLASLPAQPVIGVVVGPSVAQALDIRCALFRLQQARPDADWVLLGKNGTDGLIGKNDLEAMANDPNSAMSTEAKLRVGELGAKVATD